MRPERATDRFLIVRLGAIGDVAHTLPCLHAIRAAHPDAYIAWLVEELSAPLLRDHPELDEIFVIPKKRWRKNFWKTLLSEQRPFVRNLRSRRFDFAFDFQGLTKSGMWAWLSGARVRVGYGDTDGREFNKWFTNIKVRPPEKRRHVVERNLSLLSAIQIQPKDARAVLSIGGSDRKIADDFLSARGLAPSDKIVAINPGAGWITKQWIPEKISVLASRIATELKLPVVLTWGPGEEKLLEKVMSNIRPEAREKVWPAPKTTLREFIALLDRVSVFVGGDTGPTHLAAAKGIPIVAFFGGSDAHRNAPYLRRRVVVQKREVRCVPCWKTKCKNKNFMECMKKIEVEELFQGVKRLFGNA